jgi:hypothetical protein
MSKHTKRDPRRLPDTEALLASLQYRAEERCSGLGHALGYWSHAKRKKHGVASMQAICVHCGEMIFVSPYLEYTREHPHVPAIKGDMLFQLCYTHGHVG